MLNMLEDHGKTLGGLVTSVAVIEEQTKDFPTLKDRVRKLEEFKWKTVGIIGAAAGLGWLLENHVKIAEIFSK
jgi:hypothetical protein